MAKTFSRKRRRISKVTKKEILRAVGSAAEKKVLFDNSSSALTTWSAVPAAGSWASLQTSDGTTGQSVIDAINSCAQGTKGSGTMETTKGAVPASGVRVGNKVHNISLEGKYMLLARPYPGDNAKTCLMIRVIVLRDKEPNGTALLSSVVNANSSIPSELSPSVFLDTSITALQNPLFSKRFSILYDKLHMFCHTGIAVATAETVVLAPDCSQVGYFKIPLKFDTLYSGNNGTSTDIDKNGLYCIFQTDTALNSASTWTMWTRASFKWTFTDD